MCIHNVCIDRNVDQEIRPPLRSRSRGVQHRPHINNNGGPAMLLSDDGACTGKDSNDMTCLRQHISQQMHDLEMRRPSVAIERVAEQQRRFPSIH